MGGKTSTSKQKVQIPKEVLARYNMVNQQAQGLAGTPFKQYSTDPSDFVAGMNPAQMAAMGMTAQFGANIDDMIGRGTQGVDQLGEADINRYMSPYLNDVVNQTMKQLDYTQGQQRSNQMGQAVMNGAFGGDRGGVAAANLAYTQDMSRGSTLAGLLNQGYNQALSTAAGQQQVQAENLNRILQGAGLEGQVGLAAANQLFGQGTTQQQTDQAGKSALYNQFLQQQSYPFQVVQFLANIAEGTGALSGSTTTTQTPGGFFSDRRLKTDVRRVGHTDDGLPIYKYKYKGDPKEQTHIGLMADEVEKKHPEAVGLAAGFKTVDYDKATPKADGGGLGGVGIYGAGLNIPMDPGPQRGLMLPGALPSQTDALAQAANTASNVSSLVSSGKDLYDTGKKAYDWFGKGKDLENAAYGMAGVSLATGGVVPGQDPDAEKKKLDIPDQQTKPTGLAAPSSPPPAARTGLDAVKDIVDIGTKIIPMFMADGGAADTPDDEPRGKLIYDRVPTEDTGVIPPEPQTKAASMEPTPDNILHVARHAIGSIESSNNYGIVGPATKRKDGSVDRPYGKYQVMGSNIPQWTAEVFGKPMTPDEFLANSKAQDAVFDAKFGQYLKKTGSAMDAASMWFTGRPASKVPNETTDALGTSIPAYLAKFAKASGAAPAGGVVPTGDESPSTPAPSSAVPASGGVIPAARQAPSDDSFLGKVKGFASDVLPSSPEGKLALLAGVFGMLASPNHWFLQTVGSGGLAGIQTYSDLVKLKNESLKNTMGMIQNRFSTVDGQNYVDRYTGQMIGRDQYAAAVNNMLQNTGIGGVGTGVVPPPENPVEKIVSTMPPTPEAPAPSSGGPAVDTAKGVLSATPTPPTTDMPPPTDGAAPETAAAAPATNVATPPQDTLSVRAAMLKDPSVWENVPDSINAPKLFAQADDALRKANEFREKGRMAAPYNEAYSKNMYDQAQNQLELYKTFQERATLTLNAAAEQRVAGLNKNVESQYEFIDVQPTVGGPKIRMTKADALAAAKRGEVIVGEQSPTETDTIEVLSDPAHPETSDTEVITKAEALRRRANGIPVVTKVSPTKTETMEVGTTPTGPRVLITKAKSIEDIEKGNPPVSSFSPTQTTLEKVQAGVNAPITMSTQAQIIDQGNKGQPVVVAPNPIVAEKIKQINTVTIPDMANKNDARQELSNRLNSIADIMSHYETGAWDTHKADILKNLRALGFDIPQDKASAPVQEIMKLAINQVYDQIKAVGGRPLVSEIEGMNKTVPTVGSDPDANRSILGYMKGMLDYEQKYYNDFMKYRQDNPEDPNIEQWQNNWVNKKENNPSKFVDAATRKMAPKGMTIPAPKDREENTLYNYHGNLVYWDKSKGQFYQLAQPTE